MLGQASKTWQTKELVSQGYIAMEARHIQQKELLRSCALPSTRTRCILW